MNTKWKITIAALAGVLAIGTGVGVVAAKSADPTTSNNTAGVYLPVSTTTNADGTVYPYYCGQNGYMGPGMMYGWNGNGSGGRTGSVTGYGGMMRGYGGNGYGGMMGGW